MFQQQRAFPRAGRSCALAAAGCCPAAVEAHRSIPGAAGSGCLHGCHSGSEQLPSLASGTGTGSDKASQLGWAALTCQGAPGDCSECGDKCTASLAGRLRGWALEFCAQTSVTACCGGARSQLFVCVGCCFNRIALENKGLMDQGH